MLLAGVVQGSVFEDLREDCARRLALVDVDVHPIGGVVPLMEQYRFAELADVIVASKKGLDPSRPVHLFGAGHPMLAYTLLIFAYINHLREATVALAGGLAIGGGWGAGGGNAGSSLLIAGPFMELVLVLLLSMVIVGQLAHLMVKRNRYSVMVTLSFLLLLASHVLIMLSPLEDVMYVMGRVLELAGFVSIFGVLYGLRRGG